MVETVREQYSFPRAHEQYLYPLPYLNNRRELEDFPRWETVLLIDNCSPHMSDIVTAVLTRERVRIVTFASHTTQIFQMLDMVLFGVFKKHGTGLSTLEEEQSAAAFILKICHDFQQTMVELDIWNASAAIRFTHQIEQNAFGLLFDEEKFRESLRFAELSEGNRGLESLSKRSRESKIG
jgi:hypothetical protein